jgi:hypothetical protein
MQTSASARLRTSLAANTDPYSPDNNGKVKAKSAVDSSSSPGNAKRRKASGSSGNNENAAPAVDAAQQGSIGYVPLVTSFFSNVLSWTTSLFSASGGAEDDAVDAPSAPAAAAKATRTVVQTKAFALTPDDLINETPAR